MNVFNRFDSYFLHKILQIFCVLFLQAADCFKNSSFIKSTTCIFFNLYQVNWTPAISGIDQLEHFADVFKLLRLKVQVMPDVAPATPPVAFAAALLPFWPGPGAK